MKISLKYGGKFLSFQMNQENKIKKKWPQQKIGCYLNLTLGEWTQKQMILTE